MRDIGKNIRTLRMEQNMTQQELADRLFVTRQTVSNYESSRSNPDIDMLVRIAEVFGADVNHLIYGRPVPQDQKLTRKRFFILLGVAAALFILAALLSPWAQYQKRTHFRVFFPLLIQVCLTIPAVFLSGWCAMQGLSLCTALRPFEKPWVRPVRAACLALLGLSLLVVLPYLVYMAVVTVWTFQRTEINASFPNIPLYSALLRFHILHILPNPWLCFPLGAGMWLLGWPGHKRTKNDPVG